jgi:UDP-glucuronate 4-epimerase
MKILITGAAGFIGSHLSERLLNDGHEVCGFDSFDPYYDISIKEANVARLEQYPQFNLVRGDIRDAAAIDELWRKFHPDRVMHLAARAGVRPSIAEPALYSEVNITATIHLFEAARRHGTPVVFASSSSVYGGSDRVPYAEDDPVNKPISPYAASKRAGELMAATYFHLYQIPIICLRFFTVYGPGQRPDMAIHKFAKAILTDQPITLFGDGSTARDYTYVDDIVQGIVASIERAPQLGYAIFNLGNGHTVQLLELVQLLEKATGKTAQIHWDKMQPGDVLLTSADISHAQKLLDYQPQTSIETGLRNTVEWLRTQL